MVMEIEFTDRYKATGTPYPDPEKMCLGQCDGMGYYPQYIPGPDDTNEEHKRWNALHAKPHKEECDGYHFIVCPDCEGTRIR